jgi:hypothetical protein
VAPLSGNNRSACTADTGCASFPLTPRGAANPSITPRLSPVIGTQANQPANQTGGAIAGPSVGTLNSTSSLNQAGALNPGGTIASPGIGTTPIPIGGLNQTSGLNRTGGAGAKTPAGQAGGAPASRTPSMSSNSFDAQCANSPSCSAFQGQ